MKNRFFYGWWVVILGSLINAVGMGILYQSFTVFFLPLKRDLAVSSAAISILYGAARLEGGLEGPVVGHLIDRFGPRTIIFAGACMTGVGLILLATAQSFWPFFFIYVFVVSLGSNAGFFHPITAAVNNWFIRSRGVGFACIGASASIGGMVLAPVLSYVILQYGWRTGAVSAGLLILAVALPASLPIHRSPETIGLHPDGRQSTPVEPHESQHTPIHPVEANFSVKQALKTSAFWLLLTIFVLRLFVTVALNTHFVPILVWKGLGESTAAYLVSLFSFSGVFTMLGTGWVGDRWNKPLICSICIIPTVAVMMGLAYSHATLFVYIFPIAFAITMGLAPISWSLIGDFFGRKAYATLRGIMGVGYGTATFVSPIYAGWVYDTTGSYRLVLTTFSIILLITAGFFVILRPPSPVETSKKSIK